MDVMQVGPWSRGHLVVIRGPKREGVGPSIIFSVTSVLSPFHKAHLLMVPYYLTAPRLPNSNTTFPQEWDRHRSPMPTVDLEAISAARGRLSSRLINAWDS